MVILHIDIDGSGNVTVRGKEGHAWNANGKTPLHWQAKPGKNHRAWTVSFGSEENSPFDDGKWEFGKEGGAPDGGTLKSHDGPKEHFKYDVTCTDEHGTEFRSDPEVVLWPD